MERGVLNTDGNAISGKTFGEEFTFDTTGNWLNYKQDASGDGTFEVNQTRTHNAANEILTISGGNTLVSHDRNGCMTKIPKPLDGTSGYTLVYDAWNRLISVSDGDTVVATYVYDARNHRIKKTVGNTVTLSCFNRNWQEIESVTAGVTTTYVYGLRYIDDIICRTTSSNGNIQTLYALQDPNWNVVALVTPSGSVAERMTYDSFGRVTFRNSDFTTKVSSSYAWSKTFTGQVYDVETGLMLYRNRYYHPTLGRFITRDPIGYDGDSVNLYRYVRNNTILYTDELGNIIPIIVVGVIFIAAISGCDSQTTDVIKNIVCGEADTDGNMAYQENLVPNADQVVGCNTCNNTRAKCERCCEENFDPKGNLTKLGENFRTKTKLEICLELCLLKSS